MSGSDSIFNVYKESMHLDFAKFDFMKTFRTTIALRDDHVETILKYSDTKTK